MSNTSSTLRGVTRMFPCLVCNGTRRCVSSSDGLIMCRYRNGPQPGFHYFGAAKNEPRCHLYRLQGDRSAPVPPPPPDLPESIAATAYRLAGCITEPERLELANHLGLLPLALDTVATIGYDPEKVCWTFPERDAKEQIIGLTRRYKTGKKSMIVGSRRGLTLPEEWDKVPGPVVIVEGASDVLALSWLKVCVVGRPSNTGGAEELANLLLSHPNREIIVMGEWDAKPNGQWPGRDGAIQVAGKLQRMLGRPVTWALPPHGAKDARVWLHDHELSGPPHSLGQSFLQALERQKPTEPTLASASPEAAAQEPAEPQRWPIIRVLAAVSERPIHWLWPGWIARGTLTLLDGDPGLGKSTLLADIAARITRGLPMPGCTRPAGAAQGVLLLSAEDDVARVLRPRLRAAGADLDRVFGFEAVRVGNACEPPVLPVDLLAMEKLIHEKQIALVAIDPLMAFLSGGVDANRDQDIRRALHRLKELAERTDAGLTAVRHLNKSAGMQSLYRGGGSIGIIGASRSALLVGRDPEDMTARILAMNKCNLAKIPRSLRFRVEDREETSVIAWLGESDLTAQDVLKVPASEDDEPLTQVEACGDFLKDLLTAGPIAVTKAERTCQEVGFSPSCIRRARRRLKLKVRKEPSGKWALGLP